MEWGIVVKTIALVWRRGGGRFEGMASKRASKRDEKE